MNVESGFICGLFVQEKDAIAIIKSVSVHPACLELAITEGVRKRRLFTPESLISQGPRDRSLTRRVRATPGLLNLFF